MHGGGAFGKVLCTSVLALMGVSGTTAVSAQENHCLKIEAAEKTAEGAAWENQFFIKFSDPLSKDTEFTFSMDVQAAKSTGSVGIGTQGQSVNLGYLGGFLPAAQPIGTTWKHIEVSGKISTDNVQAVAFDLSGFAQSNIYYFDNMSMQVNGNELITNGDCEGSDFKCFFAKKTNGAPTQVESAILYSDITPIEITALDVSNVADEITYGNDLKGTFGATYSDEKCNDQIIPLSEATIIFDNELIGEQTLTLKYKGLEATKKITVKGDKISEVDLSGIPEKVILGDELSGKIKVIYKEGEPKEINIADAHTNFKSDACGEQNVTIGYDDNHVLLINCGESANDGPWDKQIVVKLTEDLEKNKLYYISFKAKASLETHASKQEEYSFQVLPNGDRWDCPKSVKLTQEFKEFKDWYIKDEDLTKPNINAFNFFVGQMYGNLYLDDFTITELDPDNDYQVVSTIENETFEEGLSSKWENGVSWRPITFTRIATGEPIKGVKKVTVVPESITITKKPKTTYVQGSELSLGNGILTLNGKNDVKQTIALDKAELKSTFNKDEVGKQTLEFEYLGAKTTLEVEVIREIKEIAVTAPTKVEYIEGQELDLTGGKITITYTDETTADPIDLAEAEKIEFDNTKIGADQEVKVTYGGKETTFKVTVKAKSVASIELATAPTKTKYVKGDELDLTGGEITVKYDNGTEEKIALTAEGVTVEGYNKDEAKEQEITVKYGEKTATFKVTVSEAKAITAIEVKAPAKVEYIVGQELDLKDGEITVKYNTEETEKVALTAEGVKVEGFDNTKAEKQTIKITYAGQEGSFEVTVIAKAVASIEVKAPSKVEYTEDEELDLAGGEITVKYNNEETEKIALTAEGVKIEGFDNTKADKQTLTVTFGEKTATFDVTVKAKENTETATDDIVLNDVAKIWSFENKVIVENAKKEIVIVNASGREVKRVRPESNRAEIALAKGGVYIVKTGVTTKKVFVK